MTLKIQKIYCFALLTSNTGGYRGATFMKIFHFHFVIILETIEFLNQNESIHNTPIYRRNRQLLEPLEEKSKVVIGQIPLQLLSIIFSFLTTIIKFAQINHFQ